MFALFNLKFIFIYNLCNAIFNKQSNYPTILLPGTYFIK